MKIRWIIMEGDFETYSVSELMKTIPERDLVFIATYEPTTLNALCTLWGLELQLKKEGKFSNKPVIIQTGEFKNPFVYLWYKFKEWLYSKFGKTESMKK